MSCDGTQCIACQQRGNHHPPGRAMDFNDGTRIVYDETHEFDRLISPTVPVVPFTHPADRQRLRDAFGDEWECMHRQAVRIATISPLSYTQAVDRIIQREKYERVILQQPRRQGHTTTMEAFEAFGRAWAQLVGDIGKALEPLVGPVARRLEPPANVMEQALQARKNRNTGPARPSGQAARRPRRHK